MNIRLFTAKRILFAGLIAAGMGGTWLFLPAGFSLTAIAAKLVQSAILERIDGIASVLLLLSRIFDRKNRGG